MGKSREEQRVARLERIRKRVELREKNKIAANPEAFGSDDRVWVGDYGNLDTVAVDHELFDPRAMLAEVLRRIIAANKHPDGLTPDARLEMALNALLGGKPLRRGPKVRSSDDPIIETFALGLFREELGYTEVRPLAERMREALCAHGEEMPSDDRIKAIIRKFQANRDLYLHRASMHREFIPHRRYMDEALDAIAKMGVEVDRRKGPN